MQKPRCGATVCVQRKSLCVHFDVNERCFKCDIIHERPTNVCILLGFYTCGVFYNTLSVIKIKCWFPGGKRMVVPDPLPLAYAVYAFINVDNCERPLRAFNKLQSWKKIQTLNAVFSVITIFGTKVNRSPEVNGQCPRYFYTTIMR